ncbi:hypothetical protein Avbf_09751 [Armadillidium vulgare]|nr:hypothetical protein Avbf_09751 [Armadillidium vulgare]
MYLIFVLIVMSVESQFFELCRFSSKVKVKAKVKDIVNYFSTLLGNGILTLLLLRLLQITDTITTIISNAKSILT